MGAQSLTNLLTIFLIISIIILFVLVAVFIFLYIRNKKQKNEKKKENEIKLREIETNEKLPSNIVQTKTYTTENIKNFLDFTEIKDNMILQNNGKRLVMVIQCKGVNYDLMSSVEKTGVEQGFAQFLNTLRKPIQIYIQARKVNLEESIINYKQRLETIESNFNLIRLKYEEAQKSTKISAQELKNLRMEYVRQQNLYEYTRDVIANTERMSLNQNILTKNYYIAISYSPDNQEKLFQEEEIMEMAFAELYTNAQALLGTLAVCGVTGKILDSVELAELLYMAYNRDNAEIYEVDKAIESEYDALYTTAPDVISRRMAELDKKIDEEAFKLADETVNKIAIRNRREQEVKQKEEKMEELIKEMAKEMIVESQEYLTEEIVKQSIEEIENMETKKEIKNKKVKKGA